MNKIIAWIVLSIFVILIQNSFAQEKRGEINWNMKGCGGAVNCQFVKSPNG